MADPVETFSHQMKNTSFTRADDGTLVATVDFEGTAEGFGTVFSTLRVPIPPGSPKSGSCTWMGQGHPEGSPPVTGVGDGSWEQVADQQRWKVSVPVMEISDGSRLRCEGEIDLTARTFTGQMFAAS